MKKPLDIIVIGSGAAGLLAAGTIAKTGVKVTLYEKNDRPGKKLLITGKGRCNITNEADVETFIQKFPETGKFLYSALYSFSNWMMIDLLEKYGVPTQIERGGRIFPASGVAKDVVNALVKFTKEHGVKYVFNKAVEEILLCENKVDGIKLKDGTVIKADRVVLATGGSSYPGTGSSGDGYKIARKVGHTITPLFPSLVPLVAAENWIPELQGLSLRNVTLNFKQEGKLIGKEFGEMLFTDYGISGPIVLSQSREIVPHLKNGPILATLDLKPALDQQKLENRIMRDFAKFNKKDFKNSLSNLIPRLLIPIIIRLSEIPAEKKVHQITIQERKKLIELLKNLTFTIIDHRGFKEAIVTRGGVTVKEIDPGTMESKKISGLYFAGEVIDIDAYTGGYNLQAAFSTGYLAGISAAES